MVGALLVRIVRDVALDRHGYNASQLRRSAKKLSAGENLSAHGLVISLIVSAPTGCSSLS
jgi:hypothetical protein